VTEPTDEWKNELFSQDDVTLTVLLPPRESANGLLYSYGLGDITAEQVRDIVFVHCMQRKLTYEDLANMDVDEEVETLLEGAVLKPSVAPTASTLTSEGLGSIGLLESDLDACAKDSVLHTVKGLIVPAGITLPPSAAPRSLEGEGGGGGSGGLSTIARYSIIAAGVLLGVTLLGVIMYFLCCARAKPAEPDNTINMAHFFNATTTTAHTGPAGLPYWVAQNPGPFDDAKGSQFQQGTEYLQGQGVRPGYNLTHNNMFMPETEGQHLRVSSMEETYNQNRAGGQGPGMQGSNAVAYGIETVAFAGGAGSRFPGSMLTCRAPSRSSGI
jgi:hypothetical protein